MLSRLYFHEINRVLMLRLEELSCRARVHFTEDSGSSAGEGAWGELDLDIDFDLDLDRSIVRYALRRGDSGGHCDSEALRDRI